MPRTVFHLHPAVLNKVPAVRFWRAAVAVVVLGSPLLATSPPKPLEIEIVFAERDLKFEGKLNLRLIGGDGVGTETVSVETRPGVLSVPLPPGRWLATLESSQAYASPTLIDHFESPGAGNSRVRWLAWATGQLSGSLQSSAGRSLPSSVLIEFSRPPDHQATPALPSGRVPCPVERSGRLQCLVPVGPLDLVVRGDGFVPHYRWDVRVNSDQPRDLGKLVLVPGASVAGRIAAEGAPFDPTKCLVRLVPRVGAGATETDYVLRKRLTGTGPVASVDERGFFQFRGVPPGAYRLEGLHPGFATAVLPEVDILAENETTLDAPLLLRPPVELTVVLDPPLDVLDRPWQVTIAHYQESESAFDAPIFDGKASLGGVVRLRDVIPGRYWISASDTSGARLWSDPEVRIEGQGNAEVAVTLDYLAVRGRLRYGDEPVAGQVWFGGRHGLVRTEVETDPDGHFEALLPRAGLWNVEVELSHPAVRRTFRRTLERGADGWAELELTVPATRIFGRVVDEAGRPVAGARAFAAVAGEPRQTSTTDSAGRFEIEGAPIGEIALSAESSGPEALTGESLFLQLFEDQALGPVEIALTKRQPLTGRVLDRSGPIAGALVSWLVLVPETVGSSAPALTDHQGRFALSVPGRARELLVTIAAPGRALSVQRLPVRPEVDLVVESEGGELALDVGSSRDPADATGREGTLAFFVDGLPVGTATLARWARDHGASAFRGRFWRLPRLSPGLWSVCVGSETVASGIDPETWRGKARCVEGWVVPGGRLELALEALETRSQR